MANKEPNYYPRLGAVGLDGGAYFPVMVRPQDHYEDGKLVGMSMGGPIAYCDTVKQARGLAAALNALDEANALLGQMREYMDERSDAEYVDGDGTPHGNTEMGYLVEIDRVLALTKED